MLKSTRTRQSEKLKTGKERDKGKSQRIQTSITRRLRGRRLRAKRNWKEAVS